MIFEIGDIVICTGFDHLPKVYDGQNLLEACGFNKDKKLKIVDIFYDSLLFDNPSSRFSNKISIGLKYFTKLEDIRHNKLLTILNQ
jgi:hypothetical protein